MTRGGADALDAGRVGRRALVIELLEGGQVGGDDAPEVVRLTEALPWPPNSRGLPVAEGPTGENPLQPGLVDQSGARDDRVAITPGGVY